MKLLMGAAVAVLLAATPAMAQTTPADTTSACGALAATPDLPDGAEADHDEMEAGNTTFNAWATGNRAILTCRRAEADALIARARALSEVYEAGVAQLNAGNASWEAEVTEYNGRNQGSRRRR